MIRIPRFATLSRWCFGGLLFIATACDSHPRPDIVSLPVHHELLETTVAYLRPLIGDSEFGFNTMALCDTPCPTGQEPWDSLSFDFLLRELEAVPASWDLPQGLEGEGVRLLVSLSRPTILSIDQATVKVGFLGLPAHVRVFRLHLIRERGVWRVERETQIGIS